MGCFVWRVPLPEDYFIDGSWKFEFVRNELFGKHILRQGWGIEDLRKGESAYARNYGGSQAEAEDRFDILAPMLDIKVGDYIVIPKLSLRFGENKHGDYFSVVVCAKVYDFSFPNICEPDFGHFVEVKQAPEKKYVTYDYAAQPSIRDMLKSYQKAINRVKKDSFTNAIASLP